MSVGEWKGRYVAVGEGQEWEEELFGCGFLPAVWRLGIRAALRQKRSWLGRVEYSGGVRGRIIV